MYLSVETNILSNQVINCQSNVVGPELPPNGVELPLGIEFDEQQTITAIGSGWGFSIIVANFGQHFAQAQKVSHC